MKREDLTLWVAVLAGPVIWALAFVAKFFLSYWVCTFRWKPAVYAISFLAMAITASAGLAAWSQWRQLGAEPPGDAGGAIARSRAMALGGLLLNALFFIVLIANTLPEVMLEGCE